MRKFGIIGYPLQHSFSKDYFTKKFSRENIIDASFEVFEINNVKDFRNFLHKNENLYGLSVTIPFKELILNYLDELHPEAAKVGAVNSIKIIRKGKDYKAMGFNTDIYGFEKSITPLLKENHKKALILGTGGSSKAVAYVFDQLGIEYIFVSRSPYGCKHIRYEILNKDILSEHTILVNCTPIGMYPDIDQFPSIAYELITSNHLLFDLIYNPAETLFLKKGREAGAVIKNGMEMLQLQAEKSWIVWNE